MTTNEILGLLGAIGLGSIVTAIVAAGINHVLSGRRWDRERRSSEVAHHRNFSDRLMSARFTFADMTRLEVASELPDHPKAVIDLQLEVGKKLQAELDDLNSITRRSPEPLTDHTRLFVHRLYRAYDARPPDQEYANFALVRYREALDEYIRRGKTTAPKLRPNESWPDDPF